MNREIKFRAWDIGAQKMLLDSNILNYQTSQDFNNETLELTQSTGLLDKQGVEIYEGDILQIEDDIFQVKYVDNCFCAVYSDVIHTEFEHLIFGEIIGNIYENKELLNE